MQIILWAIDGEKDKPGTEWKVYLNTIENFE